MSDLFAPSLDGLSTALYSRSLSGASSLSTSAVSRGAQRLQRQDHAGAVAEFERAVAYDPRNLDAQRYIGRTYVLMGRTDEAIAAYRKAVRMDPTSTEARTDLARTCMQAGRWAEAEAEYKRLAAASPASAGPAAALGHICVQTERLDEAEVQLERVARLAPSDPASYYSLGLLRNRQQRHDEAVPLLERAIDLDRGYAAARAELAYAHIGRGDDDAAQAQADALWEQGTAESRGLAAEVELALYTPRIAWVDFSKSTFMTAYGPNSLVSTLDPALATPGATKVFSMVFQFNQAMDLASVQDRFNWSITKAAGGDAGVYDNGFVLHPDREVALLPVPISVRYDPLEHTATVYFSITQNATGDGVIDPSHWVFRFGGTDAAGNPMDPRFDEYDGWYRKPF